MVHRSLETCVSGISITSPKTRIRTVTLLSQENTTIHSSPAVPLDERSAWRIGVNAYSRIETFPSHENQHGREHREVTRKKTLGKRMRLFWADAELREIGVSDEIEDADDVDVHPSALEAAMDSETGRLAITEDIFTHSSVGWGRDHHFDYISERTPVFAFLVSRGAASSSSR